MGGTLLAEGFVSAMLSEGPTMLSEVSTMLPEGPSMLWVVPTMLSEGPVMLSEDPTSLPFTKLSEGRGP